jgi:hypothetical protein
MILVTRATLALGVLASATSAWRTLALVAMALKTKKKI